MPRLGSQALHLLTARLTGRLTRQTLLSRLQELLRPPVIQVLVNSFPSAQLRNAVLTAQAIYRREVFSNASE